MKFFFLGAIALAFPVTSTYAKGDYRPFSGKASKTRKSQHGVFVGTTSKASKSAAKTHTIAGDGILTNTSLDGGREEKNSEDGGLVVTDGTAGASGSGGGSLNQTTDVFDDDSVAPSSQDFDPAVAMFGWMRECAQADLDEETCLVAKTLDSLVNMDMEATHDDDATFPTTRRVLQEGGCRPELSMQDLLDVMESSREDCSKEFINYSDEDFKATVGEFWKVMNTDGCWEELCESPAIIFQLMFDHAVQCASVDFDVDQCIMDHLFSVIFAEPDSYYDDDYRTTDDSLTNHTHRVLRSLQDVVNGDEDTDCTEVNEHELVFFASFVLQTAQGRCAEMGVSVAAEDMSKASLDLVNLFGSPHCWGGAHACPKDDIDDDFDYDDYVTMLVNHTSNSSNTTSWTQSNSTMTNKAYDASSGEADYDTLVGNTSDPILEEQPSANEEEYMDLNNGTSAEILDGYDATEEDPSDEGTNQTSTEVGINGTSSTEEDHPSMSAEEGGDEEIGEEEGNDSEEDIDEVSGEEGDGYPSESVEEDSDEASDEEGIYDEEVADALAATEEGVNGTSTWEDDLHASNEGGDISNSEGNGTSTEDDQFSSSIPQGNGTTPISNATITSPPDTSGGSISTPVTDESCDVGPRSGISERSIEVPYFYIIETLVLDGVVDEIEGMVHILTCINGVDRRLSVESEIVAVESSPQDVVSPKYVCTAQNEDASCNVVEGASTLIVEGVDTVEQEEELKTNFYLQLEAIFDMFSTVEDPNIVRLDYVGSDPSSLTTRAEVEGEEITANDSFSLFKFIAIGASIVTLIMVFVGVWKMKGKDSDDSALDGGKPIDDKSLAVETAAMTAFTMNTSADDTSSDISSTVDAKATVDAKEFYKDKAFVLAEEEESNWRNLGILPNQLDDIREEFSQSGSEKADEKSM